MNKAYSVVLITGAGSGLGRGLALRFANDGAKIAAVDCHEDAVRGLCSELGENRSAFVAADVRDGAGMQSAVKKLEEQLGPIDLLVANAGVGQETTATEIRPGDLDELINVNLVGVANSIAAVLPEMIKRDHGHVVAISSLASYRGMPRMAGYCAGKAGVNALMEGLRMDLHDTKISFSTICPGWIRTPMTDSLDLPIIRMMDLEDAVSRIAKAIYRRKTFHAFPSALVWRLRMLRFLPSTWSDWLIGRMIAKLSAESDS